MVSFWHVDAKNYSSPIARYLVLEEAREAVRGGKDGVCIVAPSFGPSAYEAKEMIESNDTSNKHWEDDFFEIEAVKLKVMSA